jgi:hypothetical protein
MKKIALAILVVLVFGIIADLALAYSIPVSLSDVSASMATGRQKKIAAGKVILSTFNSK